MHPSPPSHLLRPSSPTTNSNLLSSVFFFSCFVLTISIFFISILSSPSDSQSSLCALVQLSFFFARKSLFGPSFISPYILTRHDNSRPYQWCQSFLYVLILIRISISCLTTDLSISFFLGLPSYRVIILFPSSALNRLPLF